MHGGSRRGRRYVEAIDRVVLPRDINSEVVIELYPDLIHSVQRCTTYLGDNCGVVMRSSRPHGAVVALGAGGVLHDVRLVQVLTLGLSLVEHARERYLALAVLQLLGSG